MKLYSSITVQGAANVVTDFNPYTFYTQNNNYMKIVLCHDYLSVYKNDYQYLWKTLPTGWSMEQKNGTVLGTSYLIIGTTVKVSNFNNTDIDTNPVTITINNGTVVTSQGGTDVTTTFSGTMPNNNMIFYEAERSTSYHGTLYGMEVYGENDVLAHYFIGYNNNGVMGIMDKVTGTKYLPTGSNYTMNVVSFSTLHINPESIAAPSTGMTDTIAIDSETDWTATTVSDWFTLSSTAGTSADTAITITCPVNYSEAKSGTITFTNSEDTVALSLTQKTGEIMVPFKKLIRGNMRIN